MIIVWWFITVGLLRTEKSASMHHEVRIRQTKQRRLFQQTLSFPTTAMILIPMLLSAQMTKICSLVMNWMLIQNPQRNHCQHRVVLYLFLGKRFPLWAHVPQRLWWKQGNICCPLYKRDCWITLNSWRRKEDPQNHRLSCLLDIPKPMQISTVNAERPTLEPLDLALLIFPVTFHKISKTSLSRWWISLSCQHQIWFWSNCHWM